MFCLWIDLGLISNNNLKEFDALISNFVVPIKDVGYILRYQ